MLWSPVALLRPNLKHNEKPITAHRKTPHMQKESCTTPSAFLRWHYGCVIGSTCTERLLYAMHTLDSMPSKIIKLRTPTSLFVWSNVPSCTPHSNCNPRASNDSSRHHGSTRNTESVLPRLECWCMWGETGCRPKHCSWRSEEKRGMHMRLCRSAQACMCTLTELCPYMLLSETQLLQS
jgi:hypothetical protein